jgi:hypothetical protein
MLKAPVPCRLVCSACLATFPAEVMDMVTGPGGWLESDLCHRSYGVFPYPFLVAVCPCCHWAAYIRDFDKLAYLPRYSDGDLAQVLREHLREQRVLYPGSRKYQLAARTYARAGTPPQGVGELYLRGVWCARHESNAAMEHYHLRESVKWFERALSQGLSGFGRKRAVYLLGELNRRRGRFDEAVRWFDSLDSAPDWLRSWAGRMGALAREQNSTIQIL